MNTNLPTPSQLLGAGNLTSWYPGQYDLLSQTLDWFYSPARFLGMAVPTGAGKSISSLLLSRLSGARTVILTATKGLQEQYQRDAAQLGGVLVKGQNNFPCILVKDLRADEGPCHDGNSCELREQCPYRVQLRAALSSKLVITNYAYWLAQTNFSSGIGEFGLAVLDEGHQCFSAMENYLTIFISRMDIQSMGLHFPESAIAGADALADLWTAWKTWAAGALPTADDYIADLDEQIKSYRSRNQLVPGGLSRVYRSARSTQAKLSRLATVNEFWVVQQTYHGYRFVPKWVSNYSAHLFGKIPKVVVMSAILSPRTADHIGIPSNGDRAWIEMDSHFPPENTPIWHIPTARINYRTDDYGSTLWATRIDQIIRRRLDRKGIVFTVSYERAKMLVSRSDFKGIMLTHSTADVVQVVERFKKMPAPAVLVSPSVTTGYDFPMDKSGKPQYIIIGKIPYPDTKDPVTHARQEDDKEWSSFMAMETLVQSCGRMSRSVDDKTEIFCVDDSIFWFWKLNSKFAPYWFRRRWRGRKDNVPDPLF